MEQLRAPDRNLRLVVDNKRGIILPEPTLTTGPANYTIDRGQRVVRVQFERRLTLEDVERYVMATRRDAAFDPSFSELVDLTRVEEVSIDAGQAMELADRIDPFSPESRRAFVTLDAALTRVARMHQILRSPRENIGIFQSIEAAEQWLGLRSSH